MNEKQKHQLAKATDWRERLAAIKTEIETSLDIGEFDDRKNDAAQELRWLSYDLGDCINDYLDLGALFVLNREDAA